MTGKLDIGEMENLLGFLGYGESSAPIWFIGMEEGIAGQKDCGDFEWNVAARCTFTATMDLNDAHLNMRISGSPIDIQDVKKFRRLPQPWLWMARIVGAHFGTFDWQDTEEVKRCVREKLGRKGGHTFLTELSPLPRRNLGDRRWTKLLDINEPIAKSLISRRKQKLKTLFEANNPRLVVCYGLSKKSQFQDLLGVGSLPTVYEAVERSEDGRVLILPFFGNGRFRRSLGESMIQDGLFGTAPT